MEVDESGGLAEDRRSSELRAAIDRIAEAAATKAGAHAARRAARGYFALLTVLLIGATVYGRVQEGKLHAGLRASCERVNTLRVNESNRNAQVLWAALFNARDRERDLARRASAAIHRESVAYLNVSLAALRWTPQTDCSEAVEHASRYRRPVPQPFTRRFLDLRVVPK